MERIEKEISYYSIKNEHLTLEFLKRIQSETNHK